MPKVCPSQIFSHSAIFKGNAFVEDDNGRLFFAKGTSINERPAVCDADKPLITSLIRRELPRMDPEQFEQLDELSKGEGRIRECA